MLSLVLSDITCSALFSSFGGCLTLFQVVLFCQFLLHHSFPGLYDCQLFCQLRFDFSGAKPKKAKTSGFLLLEA